MFNRVIKSNVRGGPVLLSQCLSSLFSLELLKPSSELYLISPWISNVAIISNRFGQFRSLVTDNQQSELRLSEILILLANRDTKVRIISLRDNFSKITKEFLQQLPPPIEYRLVGDLHEKGLIGEKFYLRGSMNFTHRGIYVNEESVELTTDDEAVAKALIEVRNRWEQLENANY